ncbi:4-diphosphocytidyl-2C-methyl-D-erythritol kinase [Candidatus Pacearchaeota archaeon]|nr:4-diphosphocytidyl-2C-methyl-D-erythritol kinase [Candidatus Pacearchaeota archaeon]|tara:strand:+ start:294 stop:791 length:498 start_codon:yes stop_codon:yes gene_type:complete
MSLPTPGAEANRSGRLLERFVIETMRSHGFIIQPYSVDADNRDWISPNRVLTNVPYKSIYGFAGARSEFVIVAETLDRRIRVECKYQESAGSIDEKFPYMHRNALIVPEREVIFLLGGVGAKPGAVEWLRRECETESGGKILSVHDMHSFPSWAKQFATSAKRAT